MKSFSNPLLWRKSWKFGRRVLLSEVCLLLFLEGEKNSCYLTYQGLQTLSKGHLKGSCQILQLGLFQDVLLPTRPRKGTVPLTSPQVSGEKAAAPSVNILLTEYPQMCLLTPKPLAGCSGLGTSHQHQRESGPDARLCRSCLLPSQGPQHDMGSSTVRI